MSNETSCCFTGHRPQKLSFGYNENASECIRIKKEMLNTAMRLVDERGVDTFFSGMALGADIWGAEAIIYLRDKLGYDNLKLIAAVPFPEHSARLMGAAKIRYDKILSSADKVENVSPRYTNYCMQKRNEFMVDNSAYLIALYNGSPGGTRNTINYAAQCGLKIIYITV